MEDARFATIGNFYVIHTGEYQKMVSNFMMIQICLRAKKMGVHCSVDFNDGEELELELVNELGEGQHVGVFRNHGLSN